MLYHGFVLIKRRLGWLEENEVYKLSLASTPKQCATLLVTGTSLSALVFSLQENHKIETNF